MKIIIGIVSCLFLFTAHAHNVCPLNKTKKSVIFESIVRNTLDAKWILQQTHEGATERGFARNLIAWSKSHLGTYTMIGICTGPQSFDRFCETACEEGESCGNLQRCSQLSCDGAKLDSVKLWWQPAPVKYKTDQDILKNFNITYHLRPTTRIHFDNRSTGLMKINWNAHDSVTAKPNGKSSMNASSTLEGSGVVTADGPQNGRVNISFPRIASSGSILVKLRFDQHGMLSGSIWQNSKKLANIHPAEGENVAHIQWIGHCQTISD